MMIPVLLFNYQNGGLKDGGHDFLALRCAISGLTPPPAIVVLCEAKGYGLHGEAGLHGAGATLSSALGVPYVGRLGRIPQGDFGPAIYWDPTRVELLRWWDGRQGEPDDKRNLAEMRVRATGRHFAVIADHLDARSGDQRLLAAQRLARWADDPRPVLVAGDLNGCASGPHLPQRDWAAWPYRARSEKARRLPDGTWEPDTRALDHLIGRWDAAQARRVDGCGFAAVADLAQDYHPTTTSRDPLLIDWLLANRPLAESYLPRSYAVHRFTEKPFPSDHMPVSAAFDL